jgi:hypothetical protein
MSKNVNKDKLEKDLLRSRRTLETMVACQKVLAMANTKSDLLQKICETIVEVGHFRMAWIGIAQNNKSIKPLASSGIIDDYLDSRKLRYDREDEFGYPAAKAISTGEPYFVQDIINAPMAITWQTEALKRGYSSVLAL